MYEKRRICTKRDVYVRKETYMYEKRRICTKRDVCVRKETNPMEFSRKEISLSDGKTCPRMLKETKVYQNETNKETYVYQKRPIHT